MTSIQQWYQAAVVAVGLTSLVACKESYETLDRFVIGRVAEERQYK